MRFFGKCLHLTTVSSLELLYAYEFCASSRNMALRSNLDGSLLLIFPTVTSSIVCRMWLGVSLCQMLFAVTALVLFETAFPDTCEE